VLLSGVQIEALQEVLLAAARERTQDGTLRVLVGGLATEPGVALARVWLIGPGDVCEDCRLRPDCPDQSQCLHLVASDGHSSKGDSWTRRDGWYRRFPLGVRKIGTIGDAGGAPILVADVSKDEGWIAHPEWARAEGIRSFAGQPLVADEEVIGVLGVFSRERVSEEDFRSIRVFADHAAAAISRARAYDEIEGLREQLERENEYLRDEVNEAVAFGDIVGASPALRRVLQQVELVAPTDANVLIQGESGTGKELLARSIHDRSRRSGRPMIKVNCASIPKELFESEFFGHVKGSFTGAIKDRVGRFELADGGTLFLDEVGEIPVDLQSKLLRVLQEGELERVGDAATRRVSVRIIAATNRDLPAEIEGGRFREDLHYRLSVFPIEAPPLRDRAEDIEPLALHFVRSASERYALPRVSLTRRHLDDLMAYGWPGNVRELQHVIERATIMAGGGRVDVGALLGTRPTGEDASLTAGQVMPLAKLKKLEEASIRAALKRTRGKLYGPGGAAELLGVKPSTLASRMRSLGIEKT
jgi:transcriptional regulator with GAF, ATPase, and Fis domain